MHSCFVLAEEIKKIDINDPEWNNKVACLIKKTIHFEKLTVYRRMFLNLKYGPKKLRLFKKYVRGFFINEVLALKIETHEDFSERDYRKQIYGLFDWKKK